VIISKTQIGGVVYGFRRHKAVKLKNSELSQKIYETVSSAKKLDEKLKDLSGITEQVAKGASEQSSALIQQIQWPKGFPSQLTVLLKYRKTEGACRRVQKSLESMIGTIKLVAGNSESTAKSVEEISSP